MSLSTLLAAAQPLLAPAFTAWGSPVTWLEIVAFALSLWMVGCNMRVQPLGWPLAIASSLLYALLFAGSRLYGEAGLQLVFVALAFWGWWQWLRGRTADGTALAVRRLAAPLRWRVALAALALWPALGWLLRHATDSDVPWLDGLTTTASLAGQFLLGRKYLENWPVFWPVWLAVNLVSVGLFAIKALWLTVLLYALFAALSVVGWRAWRRLAT